MRTIQNGRTLTLRKTPVVSSVVPFKMSHRLESKLKLIKRRTRDVSNLAERIRIRLISWSNKKKCSRRSMMQQERKLTR